MTPKQAQQQILGHVEGLVIGTQSVEGVSDVIEEVVSTGLGLNNIFPDGAVSEVAAACRRWVDERGVATANAVREAAECLRGRDLDGLIAPALPLFEDRR